MPTDELAQQRWPDREFFWSVLFTILPEWAEAYVTAVNRSRNQDKAKSPAKEVRTIRVTDEWESKIRAADIKSSSKYRLHRQLSAYSYLR